MCIGVESEVEMSWLSGAPYTSKKVKFDLKKIKEKAIIKHIHDQISIKIRGALKKLFGL